MRIRLTTFALCLAGVTAHAQSTSDSVSGLESCIQAARVADAICAKDDPAQHGDCFAKARSAQLECLDRVVSGAPAQSAPPAGSAETARPEPPVEAASPDASPEPPASRQTSRTDQPDGPAGSTRADEAAKLSNASPPEPAPASVPPSAAEAAEAPTGAIGSNASDNRNDKPARKTDWILSETTSPVDYSPLVTAVISATSDVKDGPNALSVRCRARHTEISIRTDRAWGVSRGNDLLVDYQINERPVVRQPWSLSADGKIATYRYDPVEFLRSIPEGATFKIAVTARGNVRLAATFALTGLSGIRQKVETACQWAPSTAKASSEKR
jgi:hypothetical protein